MANFVLKFCHFCYHGNRSQSDINFNIAVKLPDLENPVWYNVLVSISNTSQVINQSINIEICNSHDVCQLVELEAWAVTGGTWQG